MAQPSNIFLNAEHESAVRTGVKTYARLKTDIRRTLRSLRDHGLALAAIKVLEAGVDLNTSLKSQAGLIESDSSAASHDPGEQPGLRQKLIRALAADAALFNEVGGRLLTADEDDGQPEAPFTPASVIRHRIPCPGLEWRLKPLKSAKRCA